MTHTSKAFTGLWLRFQNVSIDMKFDVPTTSLVTALIRECLNAPEPTFKKIPTQNSESSKDIRERVIKARQLQTERYKAADGIYCNAQMRTKDLRTYCNLDEASNTLLKTAMERLGLSARAYDRILKVARTIADLDASINIQSNHIDVFNKLQTLINDLNECTNENINRKPKNINEAKESKENYYYWIRCKYNDLSNEEKKWKG